MLRGMRERIVKLRLCRMLVFMIVSFFSLLVSFYVQGGNACPVCLSIQVSVAHAKVGKRFRNHKSVACFFLSPSPSFPFFLPFPLSPSEYVMEKGIRIYASHSKAGEGVSLDISFDNKE